MSLAADIDDMEQGNSTKSKGDRSRVGVNGEAIELQQVEETEKEIVEKEEELSRKLHEDFQKSEWNDQ